MSLFRQYNPNPLKSRVGDCPVRALCMATGKDWDTVFLALSAFAYSDKDMPSANSVWGKYLRSQGFRRHLVDEDESYTVEDFCRDHPKGTYILAIDGHVVCAVDGVYYDSWDSGQETPIYYWAKE